MDLLVVGKFSSAFDGCRFLVDLVFFAEVFW